MADTRLAPVIRYLRYLAGREADAGLPDGPLLQAYALGHDEGAFAALVRRARPAGLAGAARVLGHPQDAEDAYQATFLVLARNAGSIRKPASLASWLHGVAYRIARRRGPTPSARRALEREAVPVPVADPGREAAWRELGHILEEEVHALPEKYRLALLLCYWEGKSYQEAGRQLGCPEGTVKTRLARARRLLQGRLVRRGVSLSGGRWRCCWRRWVQRQSCRRYCCPRRRGGQALRGRPAVQPRCRTRWWRWPRWGCKAWRWRRRRSGWCWRWW